jgi:hypothetical protein
MAYPTSYQCYTRVGEVNQRKPRSASETPGLRIWNLLDMPSPPLETSLGSLFVINDQFVTLPSTTRQNFYYIFHNVYYHLNLKEAVTCITAAT